MIPFEDLANLFTCDVQNRGTLRLDFDEAAYVYKLIKSLGRPRCVEIGRLFGGSTRLMLAAGGSVLSIDNLSAKSIGGSNEYDIILNVWAAEHELSERLVIAQEDSREYSNDGYICDILFVDGDHRYEGVKADFEHWVPTVRVGGHILFHDSCSARMNSSARPDVVKYMDEVACQLPRVEEVGSLTHFIKT